MEDPAECPVLLYLLAPPPHPPFPDFDSLTMRFLPSKAGPCSAKAILVSVLLVGEQCLPVVAVPFTGEGCEVMLNEQNPPPFATFTYLTAPDIQTIQELKTYPIDLDDVSDPGAFDPLHAVDLDGHVKRADGEEALGNAFDAMPPPPYQEANPGHGTNAGAHKKSVSKSFLARNPKTRNAFAVGLFLTTMAGSTALLRKATHRSVIPETIKSHLRSALDIPGPQLKKTSSSVERATQKEIDQIRAAVQAASDAKTAKRSEEESRLVGNVLSLVKRSSDGNAQHDAQKAPFMEVLTGETAVYVDGNNMPGYLASSLSAADALREHEKLHGERGDNGQGYMIANAEEMPVSDLVLVDGDGLYDRFMALGQDTLVKVIAQAIARRGLLSPHQRSLDESVPEPALDTQLIRRSRLSPHMDRHLVGYTIAGAAAITAIGSAADFARRRRERAYHRELIDVLKQHVKRSIGAVETMDLPGPQMGDFDARMERLPTAATMAPDSVLNRRIPAANTVLPDEELDGGGVLVKRVMKGRIPADKAQVGMAAALISGYVLHSWFNQGPRDAPVARKRSEEDEEETGLVKRQRSLFKYGKLRWGRKQKTPPASAASQVHESHEPTAPPTQQKPEKTWSKTKAAAAVGTMGFVGYVMQAVAHPVQDNDEQDAAPAARQLIFNSLEDEQLVERGIVGGEDDKPLDLPSISSQTFGQAKQSTVHHREAFKKAVQQGTTVYSHLHPDKHRDHEIEEGKDVKPLKHSHQYRKSQSNAASSKLGLARFALWEGFVTALISILLLASSTGTAVAEEVHRLDKRSPMLAHEVVRASAGGLAPLTHAHQPRLGQVNIEGKYTPEVLPHHPLPEYLTKYGIEIEGVGRRIAKDGHGKKSRARKMEEAASFSAEHKTEGAPNKEAGHNAMTHPESHSLAKAPSPHEKGSGHPLPPGMRQYPVDDPVPVAYMRTIMGPKPVDHHEKTQHHNDPLSPEKSATPPGNSPDLAPEPSGGERHGNHYITRFPPIQPHAHPYRKWQVGTGAAVGFGTGIAATVGGKAVMKKLAERKAKKQSMTPESELNFADNDLPPSDDISHSHGAVYQMSDFHPSNRKNGGSKLFKRGLPLTLEAMPLLRPYTSAVSPNGSCDRPLSLLDQTLGFCRIGQPADNSCPAPRALLSSYGAMESSLDDPAVCPSGKRRLQKGSSDPLLIAPAPTQAGYTVGHAEDCSGQHTHASVLNLTEKSVGAAQCAGLTQRRDLDGNSRGTGSRRLVKRAPLGGVVTVHGAHTAPAPAPFLHNVPVFNNMDAHHFVGHGAHEVYLTVPPKPSKDFYKAKGESAEVSRHWQQLNEQANVRGANGPKEITTDEHHSSEQGERRLLKSDEKAPPHPEEAVAPPPSDEEQGSGQQRQRRQRRQRKPRFEQTKVGKIVISTATVAAAGASIAVAKPYIKKCFNCRRSLYGKREEASGPYGERSANQEDLNPTRLVKRNLLPSTHQPALGPSSAHFISTDLVRSGFGHTHTAHVAPPAEPPSGMWEPTGRLAQIRDEWSASFKADHDAPAALHRKSKASARLHRIASSPAMSNPRKLRAFGDFQETMTHQRPTRKHGAVRGPAPSPRSREGYGQEKAAALGFLGGALGLLTGAAFADRIKSALSNCYSRVARTGTLHQVSPLEADAVEPVVVPDNGPGNHVPALEHGVAHQANHQPHRNGHHLAVADHRPHARRAAGGAPDIGAVHLVRRCLANSSLDGSPVSSTASYAHPVQTAAGDRENPHDAAGGRVPCKDTLGSTCKGAWCDPVMSKILPGQVLGLVRDKLGGTVTKLGSFWPAFYSILVSRIVGTAGEQALSAFDLSNAVQWAGKVKERCLQCSGRTCSSLTAAVGRIENRGTYVTRMGAATSTTLQVAIRAQGLRLSEAPAHMLVKRLHPPTKGGLGEKAVLVGASAAALGAGFVGVKALMGGTDPVEERALH